MTELDPYMRYRLHALREAISTANRHVGHLTNAIDEHGLASVSMQVDSIWSELISIEARLTEIHRQLVGEQT